MKAKSALTPEESQQFKKCEAIISMGFRTFYEVGTALLEVSDKRLYRAEYSTFEEYCKTRWSITANYAYRLCHAAEVVKGLKEVLPIGNSLPMPTSEAVIRPITFIEDKAEQAEVYKEAVTIAGGKEPTTANVSEAMDKIAPKSKRKPKATREASKESDELAEHRENARRLEKWYSEGMALAVIPGFALQVHLNASRLADLTANKSEPSNVTQLHKATA